MSFANSAFSKKKEYKFGELSKIEEENEPTVLAAAHLSRLSSVTEKEVSIPRASSLYDACMRMHVLCTATKRKKKVYSSINDAMTFMIGNSVHYGCQNFPDLFGDDRYGFWKCLACEKISDFGPPPTTRCSCGAGLGSFIYHEFGDVITEPYKFSFHVDMFKKVGNIYRITEYKTIAKDAFIKLTSPLIQHEYQLVTYMLGCFYSKKLLVKVDPIVAYIYYFAKGHISKGLPVKVFVIKMTKASLDNVRNKLQQYKIGLIDYPKNIPLMSNDCQNKNFDCWRAKICPVREECMNL